MVRAFVSAGLVVTVIAAAGWAPFVHAHPDDHATAHHGPRAVHAHVDEHQRSTRVLDRAVVEEDDHDRAVVLQTFIAEAVAAIHVSLAAATAFALAAPEERASERRLQIAHGHDPPAVRLLPSRAPPLALPPALT